MSQILKHITKKSKDLFQTHQHVVRNDHWLEAHLLTTSVLPVISEITVIY